MKPVVYVVDDDAMVRDALGALLASAGHTVQEFADGASLLAADLQSVHACVLLDLALPDMSGIDIHADLVRRGVRLPVIFLTGHGDVATAVRAVKAGAFDFLEKPVDGADLLERVSAALETSRTSVPAPPFDRALIEERLATLTRREREVMVLVATGLSNKEIGRRMAISHRTVEIHRTRMMHKMGASNLVELVGIAAHCHPPDAAGQATAG